MEQSYYELARAHLAKYNYDSAEFAEKYQFDGNLGAIYTQFATTFRVWSPVASQVAILYYGIWQEDQAIPEDPLEIWPMDSGPSGTWEFRAEGDLHYAIYRYQIIYFTGEKRSCVDPYAKAVTVNSGHSVVMHMARTDPAHWSFEKKILTKAEDAIIYEASIRDLSMDPQTNIINKGKFLGLTETGRVNKKGQPVGIDYLANLGITHLQLMPFFDFATVDEEKSKYEYNWGYDPVNYNVPDGSFATDPYDPACRIREIKMMIQAIHDKGLSVIMDVVYNHVYDVVNHPFTVLVPGYYFRHLENGSLANGTFCGNELASERSMVRTYLVDSVLYWTNEYNIDGFRFDLMGILDVETIQTIREKLNEIHPEIFMLGEGWNMGDVLPVCDRAIPENSAKLHGVSFFDDEFRNAIRGNVFHGDSRGFVSGLCRDFNFWNFEILDKRYANPSQMIRYAEAHDNYTLFDQIQTALPGRSMDEYIRRQNLANSMIILGQGIPFIHSGQEFLRTKFGNYNSYNEADNINQIDWSQISRTSVQYFKDLICLRKRHPIFHYKSFAEILDHVEIDFLSDNLLKMRIKNGKYDFWIFFNAYEKNSYTLVDAGEYQVYFWDNKSYLDQEEIWVCQEGKNNIAISGLSTLVMAKLKCL